MSVSAYDARGEIGHHQCERLIFGVSPHSISHYIRTGLDFAPPTLL
jgi:hypothetical protein